MLAFIEVTLTNLGTTTVGLFRADSGFYDKTIVALLKGHKISHMRCAIHLSLRPCYCQLWRAQSSDKAGSASSCIR